jgi:sec-independent protein translocase protein TatA
MDVGAPELFIILAVVLLVFGSKKLPELARGMGRATKEFRRGLRDPSDAPEHKPSEKERDG